MGTCIDSRKLLVTVARYFSVPQILFSYEIPIISVSFSEISMFLSDLPIMCCCKSGH